MCGGHGIHRLLSLVTAETTGTPSDGRHLASAGGTPVDVENEVKLMYARGEIRSEAFQRLRSIAQSGELSIQDLKGFGANRFIQPSQMDRTKKPVDESILAFRRQLRTQRTNLEAACVETEESVHRMQLEVAALYQEAESTDLNPERKADARSRAVSAEQRIDLIRERLGHLKASLADLVAQLQCLVED